MNRAYARCLVRHVGQVVGRIRFTSSTAGTLGARQRQLIPSVVLAVLIVGLAGAPAERATAADVTGTITIGGAAVTVTISNANDNARITFDGTVGQRISLKASSVSITLSNVSILNPDGSNLMNPVTVTTAGKFFDTMTLTQSGTHAIYIDPSGTYTGSMTLTLYEVPADVSTPITIGGAPVSVTLTTPGQNAYLPFSGVTGQSVRLWRTNNSISTSIVKILNPDGSTLVSSGAVGTPDGSTTAELGSNGTYKVFVDGWQEAVGSMTLTLMINGDSPGDGAQVKTCGTTPVFRSEPSAGTHTYQFQIASDSAFSNIVDDSGSLPTTNTYRPAAGKLSNNATYYWRRRIDGGSWSTGRSFSNNMAMLGSRGYWPMWSAGPVSVNEATGNLFLALPGPSYPTAVGSMSVSTGYNSVDSADRGLGQGWALDAGDGSTNPPIKLINHNVLTGTSQLDAIEAMFADGSSICYTHVGQTNTYIPEDGEGSQLTRNANGSLTLRDANGAIDSFGVPDGATGVATITAAETIGATAGKGRLSYVFSTQDQTKITSITDEAGRALTFTWNSLNPTGCSNAILCVSGPDGVTWRYIGDGTGGTSGKLAKINDGTRDVAAFGYDGSGRVKKLQNANDLDPSHASTGYDGTHAVTIAYDGNNRVSTVTDGPHTGQTPTNSTWSLDYHPGQVSTTATRAPHGSLPAGTVRTAAGYTTLTVPSQQGQQTPKLVKVYYDGSSHPIETDDQLGRVTEASYNARDEIGWTEDADGNPTDYTYDTVNDVLTSVTGPDPDGGGPLGRPVTSYRYDETTIGTQSDAGAPLQGLQGSYYDNLNLAGRPVTRQNDTNVDFNWGSNGPAALPGVTDNFSVRWSGDIFVTAGGNYTFSTVSDEGTRLTVDGIQLIDNWRDQTVTTTTSAALSLSAGFHRVLLEYYDRAGSAEVHLRWACTACSPSIPTQVIPASALRPGWMNRTSTVSPSGRISFAHFADAASGNPDYVLKKLADGTKLITSFTYDAYGRTTQKVMPKGNAARTIDSSGNLSSTPAPDTTFATTWTYYGLNETATTPAACGAATSVGQAGLQKDKTARGEASLVTVYDAAGRPTSTTNSAGTSTHCYDNEGRTNSEQAPGDSEATTYSYDPSGAVLTKTDASGPLTYQYDEAGRVVDSLDSFGSETKFTYDADSNTLTSQSAVGSISGGQAYVTSYAYDASDKLTSVVDPANRVFTLYYGNRGELRAVQYPNTTFRWIETNAAGWATNVYNRHGTLPSPLPANVPADSLGSSIVDYAYTYDVDGLKTQQVRSGGGLSTATTNYAYDAVGRLLTADLPGGTSRRYCYDRDSNRTEITTSSGASCGSGSSLATYTYDPAQTGGVDQLTSSSEAGQTTTYAYTQDGQQNQRGNDTLTWDGWGRLSSGTFSGTTVSYSYDADGRVRQRSSGGSTVRYLYAGGASSFDTDGTGAILRTRVAALANYAGPPTSGTGVTLLYYDGHGDLAAEADSSGNRTASHTYTPFGEPEDSVPASARTERWTGSWGKRLDTTSGLIEMGARLYDPHLGRFLTPDPVDGGSLNDYDYAGQDPINNYDLTGTYFGCAGCAKAREIIQNALRQIPKIMPLLREMWAQGMESMAQIRVMWGQAREAMVKMREIWRHASLLVQVRLRLQALIERFGEERLRQLLEWERGAIYGCVLGTIGTIAAIWKHSWSLAAFAGAETILSCAVVAARL